MPTLTEQAAEVTRLAVETRGPGVRVRSGGGAFRAVTLTRSSHHARVALVPDRALLLAGDRVRVEVTVGPGVSIELVETTGTVAYDMRGSRAAWDVDVQVADGGTCRWEGLPFVVAGGAVVERTLTVALQGDATFTQRETLVLGRHREPPGRLRNLTRITRDGSPILVEELDGRSLSPHRVMDGVLCIGTPPTITPVSPPAAVRMELADGSSCWRSLSQEAHRTAAVLDPVWAAVTSLR